MNLAKMAVNFPVGVVRHDFAAIRTPNERAAIPAHHERRVAAPVQQNYRLLPVRQSFSQQIFQRVAQNAFVARAKFAAHVYQLNFRQRLIQNAVRQFQIFQLAGLRPIIIFQTRRRTPKNKFLRHYPRVVVRRAFLLVRRILLLVHDYQANVGNGREQRRSRSNHNPKLAAADFVESIAALLHAQLAVNHQHVRKMRLEILNNLPRQRNFRHQNYRPPSQLPRDFRQLDVHLRFA